MSQRSIRRAQQRRAARERRRATLRRRRAVLAAGAALGATALLAPSAEANTPIVVNTIADTPPTTCDPLPGDCTLREAVAKANADAGDDTITFASTVTGSISLIQPTALTINPATASDNLTIDGPGRSVLSVTANNAHRVVNIAGGTGQNTIRDLELTHGYSPSSGAGGGAVLATGATKLALLNAAVTDSKTMDTNGGGGISAGGPLTVTNTTISGNTAPAGNGGGIVGFASSYPSVAISDSTVSGNSAQAGGGTDLTDGGSITNTTFSGNHATGGNGGGLVSAGQLSVSHSTFTGNTSTAQGGGIWMSTKYVGNIADSTISGNTAPQGGGLVVRNKYSGGGGDTNVARTTISGNHGTQGAGVFVPALSSGSTLTFSHSTISGNVGTGTSFGGGLALVSNTTTGRIDGHVSLSDSTISGNSATNGGGVALGTSAHERVISKGGSVGFDNSTVAANTAASKGGGFYLNSYDVGSPPQTTSATVSLTSTIVADNKAGALAQDLDRANGSTGGGFSTAFSLVEAPGDAPVLEPSHGTVITGVDPKLGPLANNGGPTRTQLPSRTSPVLDKGSAPVRLTTDQRGSNRTVNAPGLPNPPRGDGTDIGAVEVQNPISPKHPDHKPTAVIKKIRLGAKSSKKRRASGTAKDDHKVARVEVAIVRRVGKRCRELRQLGEFSPKRACKKPRSWLVADGRKKWSFALGHFKLRHGRYVLFARAVDNKGHVQTSFGKKSKKAFRVK